MYLFNFLFWGHAQQCLEATPVLLLGEEKSLLVVLGDHVVRGVEPGFSVYRTYTLVL